jgi:hypothetical protein
MNVAQSNQHWTGITRHDGTYVDCSGQSHKPGTSGHPGLAPTTDSSNNWGPPTGPNPCGTRPASPGPKISINGRPILRRPLKYTPARNSPDHHWYKTPLQNSFTSMAVDGPGFTPATHPAFYSGLPSDLGGAPTLHGALGTAIQGMPRLPAGHRPSGLTAPPSSSHVNPHWLPPMGPHPGGRPAPPLPLQHYNFGGTSQVGTYGVPKSLTHGGPSSTDTPTHSPAVTHGSYGPNLGQWQPPGTATSGASAGFGGAGFGGGSYPPHDGGYGHYSKPTFKPKLDMSVYPHLRDPQDFHTWFAEVRAHTRVHGISELLDPGYIPPPPLMEEFQRKQDWLYAALLSRIHYPSGEYMVRYFGNGINGGNAQQLLIALADDATSSIQGTLYT